MSRRLERSLRGLILVGLALFLTNSLFNGTLLFYINRRFVWLTWVAAILLLFIAFGYRRVAHYEAAPGHQPTAGHVHGENPLTSSGAWIPLALLALPLLLGVLVPAQPLGARAVTSRDVNVGGLGLGNDESMLMRAAGERNILDWLRAFGTANDPAAFDGQEATVVGFVFRDETFPADRFMVSRFILSCCVADASAIGLVVSWADSSGLPLDTWVQVQGRFQVDRLASESSPILVADRVVPTTPPNQPYLYP